MSECREIITITKWNALNRETRDREKVMRRLKKKDTSILTGYQIYYYIFEHMKA